STVREARVAPSFPQASPRPRTVHTSEHRHGSGTSASPRSLHRAIDGPPLARETEVVAELSRLCLLLVGDVPDNWNRRVVNSPQDCTLARHRSVHYSQIPARLASLTSGDTITFLYFSVTLAAASVTGDE